MCATARGKELWSENTLWPVYVVAWSSNLSRVYHIDFSVRVIVMLTAVG
jgi:hypothetical protein